MGSFPILKALVGESRVAEDFEKYMCNMQIRPPTKVFFPLDASNLFFVLFFFNFQILPEFLMQ